MIPDPMNPWLRERAPAQAPAAAIAANIPRLQTSGGGALGAIAAIALSAALAAGFVWTHWSVPAADETGTAVACERDSAEPCLAG